jgi:hypothetical protein
MNFDPIAMIERLFTNGLGVQFALSFIVLEFAVLIWRVPKADRAAAAVNLSFALGPGACLMLALLCALTGANVLFVAFWLAASLPLHIADILRRRF